MVNYQNGKVYTIRSRSREDLIYVGSTCNSLAKRLGLHRSKYRSWQRTGTKRLTSFDVLAIGDEYIELLESYPCSNRMELERREGQLIRSMDCVNRITPGRTPSEYREDNKETIKAQAKQYHQDNRDAILAQKAQKTPCSYCNKTFRIGDKARHIKTKNHQSNYKKAFKDCFGEEFTGTVPLHDY
jgi:hypothetical protein